MKGDRCTQCHAADFFFSFSFFFVPFTSFCFCATCGEEVIATIAACEGTVT